MLYYLIMYRHFKLHGTSCQTGVYGAILHPDVSNYEITKGELSFVTPDFFFFVVALCSYSYMIETQYSPL